MVKRDIRRTDDAVNCAVCGRGLLHGEHSKTYLHAGARRPVCDLCTARAEHQGWIREGAAEVGARPPAHRGRNSLIGRLRARRPRAPAQPADGAAEDEGAAGGTPAPDSMLPPAPREPRHIHAVPTNNEMKMVRAVELFNASEHPRTVAGVARSLGAPAVSVLPLETVPSVVRLTLSWELCWYRYEVDLADETGVVRVADQGYELGELPPEEQEPNAAADAHGVLQFATA